MLANLLTRDMTLVRRADTGATDDYGNAVPTETLIAVKGELQQIAQLSGRRPRQGETSDTRWALYLPAGTDIDIGDGIIADGRTFEVVGEPWHVRDPRTGATSHVEVVVRRTAGAEDAS